MSVIAFKEIAKHGPCRSHLSDVGSMYVPKIMGGVDVDLIEDATQVTIKLYPNNEPWKRYTYIGISIARLLFERFSEGKSTVSTIPLFFEYNKEENYWFAVVDK